MGTRSYAEGGFFLMTAQFINLIAAFLTQIFLGIILGPAIYGVYGVVISVVSISTVILMGGVPLSVSKFISSNPELAYSIKRRGLNLQLLISSAVTIFYIITAPFLAIMLRDPSLTTLIQIASLALIPRALSAIYAMYFNGRHLFGRQATSWSIYGIGRLILSAILGSLFLVKGAVLGFVIAPVLSMTFGIFASRTKEKILNKFPIKKMVKFSSFTILFFLGISIFQALDIFLIKSILKDNVLAGYYNAASTLSKLPFNILGTVALVLFPATAKYMKDSNMEKMKELINESMRAVLIMLLPIILILSSRATEVVKLLYTSKYAPAGPAFTFLILALGIFTIFYVYGSMMLVSDKPYIPLFIVFFSLILDFILIKALIPKYEITGAAIGTLLASTFATLLTIIYIYKKFGTLIKLSSFVKVSSSAIIVYLISFFIPEGKIFTVLGIVILIGFYYGILWLIKEITMKDINRFKAIFTKKKEVDIFKNDL
jgi:stage V sporulation protein B